MHPVKNGGITGDLLALMEDEDSDDDDDGNDD
jgi:hypothetical protein